LQANFGKCINQLLVEGTTIMVGGRRGGAVKIENRPQQKICFGQNLQIRISIVNPVFVMYNVHWEHFRPVEAP
jgi:hypothetical protein